MRISAAQLIEQYKGDAPGYPYKYEPDSTCIISCDAFKKALENAALAQDFVGVETILDTFTSHQMPGGCASYRYQILTAVVKTLPRDEKIAELFDRAKDKLRPYFQTTYNEEPRFFD